jgi:hypothetical protein
LEFDEELTLVEFYLKFVKQKLILMSENEKFKKLLKGAGKSARQKASRKKLPIAVSENGEVKLIYPDKRVKVLRKSRNYKKAA